MSVRGSALDFRCEQNTGDNFCEPSNMTSKPDTSRLRTARLACVRELKILDTYSRTHTATGVWRRKDLLEEPKQRVTVSNRSLANLLRGRTRHGSKTRDELNA